MNLLRSVLSYSLLIIVVVIAVLAYQYREQVIPEVRSAWQDARALVMGNGAKSDERQSPAAGPAALPEPAPLGPGPSATSRLAGSAPVTAPAARPETQAGGAGRQAAEVPPAEAASATTDTESAAEAVAQTAAGPAVVPNPEQSPAMQAESQPESQVAMAEPEQGRPEPAAATGVAIGETPASASESALQAGGVIATDDQAVKRSGSGASSPPANPAPAPPALVTPALPADTRQPPPEPAVSLEAALLQQARQAYWARDFATAVAAYQKLLDADPENPDLYGELGNVYYSMGEWQAAGQAYYAAAQRLLARGQTQQIGYLLHVLEGLDRDLADQLRKQIEAHAS